MMITLSLMYNVILWGGSFQANDSGLLLKLISDHTSSFEDSSHEKTNSDQIAIELEQQYSKIRKENNAYSISLEDGDTLSQILSDLMLDKKTAVLIANAMDKVYKLKKLKFGEDIIISFLNNNGELIDNLQSDSSVLIDVNDAKIQIDYNTVKKSYEAKILPIIFEEKFSYVVGKITNNFFNSAKASGLSRTVIMDFINIFGHQIDFQRDIEFGSKFKVVHEYRVNEKNKKIKDGKIVYASLETRSKNIEIYLHEFPDGTFGYFNKDGSSVKKVLLKTPVKNAVISSGFGMRKHPILGYSRMHKGLDYAAPRGTPVIASGDGVIEAMKSHVNYGRYIKIKHDGKYSTLYAHLERFSKKVSLRSKVKQGEIIGYVGSSGRSTGPHLHYEVHVNGAQVNPAKLTMVPKSSQSLSGKQLSIFQTKLLSVEKIINNQIALSDFNKNNMN